jgi:hypothetical protein
MLAPNVSSCLPSSSSVNGESKQYCGSARQAIGMNGLHQDCGSARQAIGMKANIEMNS